MKKRTNEEKKAMIDEACDLFNDASEKIRKAKRMLHLCGIESCDGFDENIDMPAEKRFRNLQILPGSKKMVAITGCEPAFRNDYINDKKDTSRMYVYHKGLTFMQLDEERTR